MNRHFKELHSFIENTISKVGYDPELFLEENDSKSSNKKIKSIDDPIVGKLKARVPNVSIVSKKEKIKFIDKEINIFIDFKTYDNEELTKKQQDSYIWFKEHLDEINKKLPDMMIKYIKSIENDYKPYLDDEEVDRYYKKIVQDMLDPKDKLVKLFNPKQLFIDKNGDTTFLCYTQWDEHGVGIQVKPKYFIDDMDSFI